MSLETLLEAAKYIEYRSEATARGETPKDYCTYFGHSASDNNGGASFLLPGYSTSNNDDNSPSYYDSNDSKDRRRSGGAGTREVHNKLEKNRRAHLKKCFETLKKQIPNVDEKKTSNLGVLRSAFRYIQTLKRRERECELEMARLSREKVVLQQRLAVLRRDINLNFNHVQMNVEQMEIKTTLAREPEPDHDSNSNSTSTASECGPLSEAEDDKNFDELSQESVAESTGADKDTNKIAGVAADNKGKSLALLAKSAEVVSMALKTEHPSSKIPAPKTLTPKLAVTQPTPVAVRAIQPQPNAQASNVVANGGTTAAESVVSKTESQTSGNIRPLPQRAAVPAQVKAVPQATVATNGNVSVAPPTTMKVLTQQTMRILAPVATTTASKTLTMVTSGATTLTSTRVALAASSAPGNTVPITALALSKAMPGTIKRVAALKPVQAASSSTVSSPTTMKGLLTTGPSHSSIAVGQLAMKSSNISQQPILTATAINFQAAAPIATSSPAPATTMARQLVTASMKPVARSQVAQLTQVMTPTTIVSSVGTVIPGGSSMNPIVTPMSVMSSMNRAAVAQVISPSQLGKVMTAPYIKTVPIYQQQIFPHLGAVSSQALVNPIVMVTSSNVVPATTTAQATLPGSR